MADAEKVFSHSSEKDITRAILGEFAAEMDSYIESDVTIIGAGPSGLACGRELARMGIKVLIVERNNYCGGGFWIGGFLMNKLTIRAPAQKVLDELGVPYRENSPDLYVADGPHACAKLIGAACDEGVKILNMTSFDDLVIAGGERVKLRFVDQRQPGVTGRRSQRDREERQKSPPSNRGAAKGGGSEGSCNAADPESDRTSNHP